MRTYDTVPKTASLDLGLKLDARLIYKSKRFPSLTTLCEERVIAAGLCDVECFDAEVVAELVAVEERAVTEGLVEALKFLGVL